MTPTAPGSPNAATVDISDIELHADGIDLERAAAIYREHGCLVVRGLYRHAVERLRADIEAVAAECYAMFDAAVPVPEGWSLPNGALLIKAPEGHVRDKQLMVLPISYRNSAAFFLTAVDERVVDLAAAILGPDVELFMDGQCLYKEPTGGHPKNLHQDAAYFEHRYQGPVAVLTYVVDTDLTNGALHVVPGTHRLDTLKHGDSVSHLALEWPWEDALPVIGSAGDAIFFHVRTVHGSKQNHSDKARPAVINRYRRADDYVITSATTVANRQEAELHAHEVTKEGQVGIMVRGRRPYA